MSKNIVLLMMGGSGTRLGSEVPKQYLEVSGLPIFAYILRGYAAMPEIDRIVIVSNADWIEHTEAWVSTLGLMDRCIITEGGMSRSESVREGILAIPDADAEDVLLIHDATHPYVDPKGVRAAIRAIRETGAATLIQREYDTVYRIDTDREGDECVTETLAREHVVSGASPEGFRYGLIAPVYRNAGAAELQAMTSAGAIARAHGIEMKAIELQGLNLKITYPRDLELFRILATQYFWTGEDKIE